MLLLAVALAAFVAGWLVRRWLRPVGLGAARGLEQGEWRITSSGGHPYRSVIVQGRYAVTPLALAEVIRALDDPTRRTVAPVAA